MFDYAVSLVPDEKYGGFTVLCPALPELITQGDNLDDALGQAQEALITVFSIYTDERRCIPEAMPPEPGQHAIYLPVGIVAKIILWNALVDQGISQAELARRMGVSKPVAGKLFDFLHVSKIEQIERALSLLGKRLIITSSSF